MSKAFTIWTYQFLLLYLHICVIIAQIIGQIQHDNMEQANKINNFNNKQVQVQDDWSLIATTDPLGN